MVGLSAALVAAALFGADRLDRPVGSGAAAFVPADGASETGETVTSSRGRTSTVTTVTESALILGGAVAGAVDWQLGAQILADQGSSLNRSRFWRTTTSSVADGGSQSSRVYRIGTDVVLLGESGAGAAYSYRPGLVELPQAVAPGMSWQSSGRAADRLPYSARFRAAAADLGCLLVTGTIRYGQGSSQTTRAASRTWCPGLGITASTDQSGTGQVSTHRTGTTTSRTPVSTTDWPTPWRPAAWRARQLTNTAVDPFSGRHPMTGAASSAPPVMTASGILVRTSASGQDLVGFTRGQSQEWPLRWRAHPGGTVLTATAFGDVVVATTSQRRVVGYGKDGVRRWQLDLDDVVLAAPTRAAPGQLALASLGGEIVVADLGSGRVRWRLRPGSDVGAAPVVSDGVLVVADRAGDLIGLEESTGRELWRTTIISTRFLAAHADQVVVVQAGDLFGFDIRTGTRIWRAAYDGYEQGLSAFGDWFVLTHGDEGTAFDHSGRRVWNRPGLHAVSTDRTFLVCWERRQAEVLDSHGIRVAVLATTEDKAGNTQQFVAGPDGVYELGSAWTFRGWTT